MAVRRAYSYKRFSSPKQSRGDSIRRQTAFEQEIVKEMQLLLDDTLDLSDTGVSAFHGKNAKFGALAEFMKLVESGRIPPGSVLIVENIDRLSRENVFDAFNLFSRIIGAGITLVTAEPRDIYDKESVQGNVAKLMVPLVYMMRAHDESKMKSHRIHQAWNQRRKKAIEEGQPLTEHCPQWLKVVKVGGKKEYQVIEKRAKVVRDIYEWVRDGLGGTRILKRLVKQKVEPFGKKDKWHRTYVRKLLMWPAVYGQMQPHVFKDGRKVPQGEPVENYFPAIITKEEFEQTRETMKDRKGKDGRPSKNEMNLFTGLVWHAGDRVKMSMKASGPSGKKIPYLRSNLVDKGESARAGRQFPYLAFEKFVLSHLPELRPEDVSDRFCDQQKVLDERKTKLNEQLFVIDGRIKEVEEQTADPANKISAKTLLSLLTKLSEKREGIQSELTSLQSAVVDRAQTVGEVRTIIELIDNTPLGPERDKCRLKVKTRLRWLVESVWVHIEKVNHVRQFAHVQVFLRNGTKRYVIVPSFKPKEGRKDIPPARRYEDVDFRDFKSASYD